MLVQALTSQLHPSEVFGHRELLDALEQDRQELGVIVDLTNTTRYYGPQVRGHAEIPFRGLSWDRVRRADRKFLSFL